MKRIALILALGAFTNSAILGMESVPQPPAQAQQQPQGERTRAQLYLNNIRTYINLGVFFTNVGSAMLEDSNAAAMDMTEEQLMTQKTVRAFIDALKLQNVVIKVKGQEIPLSRIVKLAELKTFLHTLNNDYFNPDVEMSERNEQYAQFLRGIVHKNELNRILALAGEDVKIENLGSAGAILGYIFAPCAAIANRAAINKLFDDLVAGKTVGKSKLIDCLNFSLLLEREGLDGAQIPLYDHALLGVVSLMIDLQRDRNKACAQLLRAITLYDAHERRDYQEELERRARSAEAAIPRGPNNNNVPAPVQEAQPQQAPAPQAAGSWYSGLLSLVRFARVEVTAPEKAQNEQLPRLEADDAGPLQAPSAASAYVFGIAGSAVLQKLPSMRTLYDKLNTVINIGQFFFQLGSILAQHEEQELPSNLLNKGLVNALIRSIRWGNFTVTIGGHKGKLEEFCKIEQFKLLLQAINDDYFADEPRENQMAAYIRGFKEALNHRALKVRLGEESYSKLIARLDNALAYATEQQEAAPVVQHLDIEAFFKAIGYAVKDYCDAEHLTMLLDQVMKKQPLSKTAVFGCFKFTQVARALGHDGDEAAMRLLDDALHSLITMAHDLKNDRDLAEQKIVTCLALYDFEERVEAALEELPAEQRARLAGQINLTSVLNGQAVELLQGINAPKLQELAALGLLLAPLPEDN